jgi:hypothetical protein
MPRGGKRANAGRPKTEKVPFCKKSIATEVLGTLGKDYKGRTLPTEKDLWLQRLFSRDEAIAERTLRYLTDKRDGRIPMMAMPGDLDREQALQAEGLRVTVEYIGGDGESA